MMKNEDLDKIDKIMEVINSVKIYSGCDRVELWGNDKTFEELMAIGFPFGEFECKNMMGEPLDESRLWVVPINNGDIRYEQEA